ncbi:MAG TPA: VCBS repeat-containing protein, partial [Salinibacter sp.]|nr:VCBS repeat-containing protein [Salinibacter sp.]
MHRFSAFFVLLCTGALLWTACGGSARTAKKQEAATYPEDYRRVVTPSFAIERANGTPIASPFYGGLNTPRPQWVDIDDDGDDDLFVQEESGQIAFFEHVQEADTSRLVWRTDNYQQLDVGEWYRFADLDQDGDPDLLAEEPYSHLRVYRNTGTATEPNFELFVDSMRTPSGEAIFSDRQNIPNVTDIDCDGKLDLFLGRLDGTITRYEAAADSAGMPQFAHVTDNFEGIEIVNQQMKGVRHGANTLTFADIEGDGDPDLFWGDFFEPGLLLIENTGSCGNPVLSGEPEAFPPSNPLETSGYNAPALSDWTGNGRLDLFIGVLGGSEDANTSLADNFYFYENQADGYQLRTRQFVGGLDVGSESAVAVGDIDADGHTDALVANKIEPTAGATSRVYRLSNQGTASSAYRIDGHLEVPSAYHYAPALGDLTGDGAADLLLGTWKGKLSYQRNEGDGTFTSVSESIVNVPGGRHVTPTLGDLTGDGRLDLVVGTGDGSLYVYRNTGSSTDPAFERDPNVLADVSVGSRSAPALHDV